MRICLHCIAVDTTLRGWISEKSEPMACDSCHEPDSRSAEVAALARRVEPVLTRIFEAVTDDDEGRAFAELVADHLGLLSPTVLDPEGLLGQLVPAVGGAGVRRAFRLRDESAPFTMSGCWNGWFASTVTSFRRFGTNEEQRGFWAEKRRDRSDIGSEEPWRGFAESCPPTSVS